VCLQRDGYRCTTPGCGGTDELTADHIQSRRGGGPDILSNLRTLCGACDRQVKERPDGTRPNGGVPRAKGVTADGRPRDPAHPWA
jgi:5-methylcytosine-specific restriction protein A